MRLCLEWNMCINVFPVQDVILSVVSGICLLVCLPCNRNPWFSHRYILTKMVYFALCVSSKPFAIYIGVVIDYARYMQRQSYRQTQRQWSQYGFELLHNENYHSNITIHDRMISIEATFPYAMSIISFIFIFIEVLPTATYCPKSHCRQNRNTTR